MNIDKKRFYAALEEEFENPSFDIQVNTLATECIKLAAEWEKSYKGPIRKFRARELRKDLKIYINDRIDLEDQKKPYYFPAFVWIFIATQVINWIVRWIINEYLGKKN